MIEEIRRFGGGSCTILIGTRDGELGRFLAKLLEPKVAVGEQLLRVARRGGRRGGPSPPWRAPAPR